MKSRSWPTVFAVVSCALPLGWAVKPGDVAPDLALRDRSGTEVRLSAFRQKKLVAVLAQTPGTPLSASVLNDTCLRLDSLGSVVLFLASDTDANRKFLENAPVATLLIDPGGVVRRVLVGRVLTGPDLFEFVKFWQLGRTVFNASCVRCHGEEGDLHICEDVKPLAGIGKRLTESQIRERLKIGEVNDQDLLIRGQFFTRPQVDAVIAYVASL